MLHKIHKFPFCNSPRSQNFSSVWGLAQILPLPPKSSQGRNNLLTMRSALWSLDLLLKYYLWRNWDIRVNSALLSALNWSCAWWPHFFCSRSNRWGKKGNERTREKGLNTISGPKINAIQVHTSERNRYRTQQQLLTVEYELHRIRHLQFQPPPLGKKVGLGTECHRHR